MLMRSTRSFRYGGRMLKPGTAFEVRNPRHAQLLQIVGNAKVISEPLPSPLPQGEGKRKEKEKNLTPACPGGGKEDLAPACPGGEEEILTPASLEIAEDAEKEEEEEEVKPRRRYKRRDMQAEE